MPHVAVAHYPEGAGHATRMLAIARALEARGATISIGGGGPGTRFLECNGYDPFEPTVVDYIGDYQGCSLGRVLGNSLPASARRVRDYVRWLRDVEPAALVTDDMFAAMAAPIAGVPLYVCTHNAPGLYEDLVTREATRALTALQRTAARGFFLPAVWPPAAVDPAGTTRVGPLALEAERGDPRRDGSGELESGDPGTDGTARTIDGSSIDPDPGVLVVPSHFWPDAADLAARIEADGHRVTLVGGDDWEPVPSLQPYVEAAEVVLCAGYSTIMEATVAGRPCVVYPVTDEQRGVARVLERTGTPGIRVERSDEHVRRAVANPPPAPEPRNNGAPAVARAVLADLERRG